MAIGNPITLTNNVASKIISVTATADQTLFTVTGGYRINQIAVFRNGVQLSQSSDFTANDGSTVTLVSAANAGDTLLFRIFDDFRVADAIQSAAATQTINGDLTVTGTLTGASIGIQSVGTSVGAAKTLNFIGTGNTFLDNGDGVIDVSIGINTANIVSTAITTGTLNVTSGAVVTGVATATHFSGNLTGTAVTATTFVGALTGNATGLSGTPDITVRNVTGVGATFSGDVNISGTLSYEDVTNIDSLGIVTARSGLRATSTAVGSGVTVTGVGELVVSQSTQGQSATLFLGYGGSSKVFSVDESGNAKIGSNIDNAGTTNISLNVDGSADFASDVSIADKIIHTGDTNTAIRFPAADTVTVETAGSERLRIASDGDIRVGSAFSVGQAGVVTCSTVEARVPQIPQNAQASAYVLVKADAGKHINAGGNVTVNSGIFAIGDCISIFNDTTGDITITQGSSVTLRLVADTSTGSRTLANYGLAAVLCVGSNEFVVSGGGVS